MNSKDQRETERQELRRNQLVGIAAGVFGGVMVAYTWPGINEAIGLTGALLWGAAIGGALGSLPHFSRLGKRLTQSENNILNLLVGLSVPFAIVALLALAVRLMG